jgi:HK97 family phage prohead protease
MSPNRDSLTLTGHAAVFDSPAEDLGFDERIARGAFRNVLASGKDQTLLLWSHSTAQPLARVGAGLELWEDQTGLAFRAKLADTQLARDAMTLVRAGVVSGMWFGFTVKRQQFDPHSDTRTIQEIGRLFEISLVAEPAYPATAVTPAVREARARLGIETQTGKRQDLGRIDSVRQRAVYGADSPNSYFRDLYAATMADKRAAAMQMAPGLQRAAESSGVVWGPGIESQMAPEQVRERLACVQTRDLTSIAGQGGEFLSPGGVPGFVADAFVTAAHVKAALASVLHTEPLPKTMGIVVPQVTGAASVASQATDDATVSKTDIVSSKASSNVRTIAGDADAALQLLEQSMNFDTVIAAELAAAFAEQLEQQIINGSGAGAQLLGIANTSGISSVSYTSGTPAAGALISKSAGGSVDGDAVSALRGPTVRTGSGLDDAELFADLARNAAAMNAEPTVVAPVVVPSPTALDRREAAAGIPAGWAIDPDDDDYAVRLAAARAVRAKILSESNPQPVATTTKVDEFGMTPKGRYVLAAIPSDLADKVADTGSRAEAVFAHSCRIARLVRSGDADHDVAYAATLSAALDVIDDDKHGAREHVRRGFRVGTEG